MLFCNGQLLSGNLRIDYSAWLQTPLTLSIERAWMQIAKRFEFQENTKLSIQDTVMVAFILSQLKSWIEVEMVAPFLDSDYYHWRNYKNLFFLLFFRILERGIFFHKLLLIDERNRREEVTIPDRKQVVLSNAFLMR